MKSKKLKQKMNKADTRLTLVSIERVLDLGSAILAWIFHRR
jgi:hypothetical protein